MDEFPWWAYLMIVVVALICMFGLYKFIRGAQSAARAKDVKTTKDNQIAIAEMEVAFKRDRNSTAGQAAADANGVANRINGRGGYER